MSDIEDFEKFTRPIRSGLELTDDPVRLPPAVERELRQRLDDLDHARAIAMVNAQNYVVWR